MSDQDFFKLIEEMVKDGAAVFGRMNKEIAIMNILGVVTVCLFLYGIYIRLWP